MCYPIVVHVVYPRGDLVSDVSRTIFSDFKFPSVEVLKEVSTRAILKHYVYVFRVFKNIDQPYYVRVLAYLEHLDLSLLQFKLLQGHVLLLNHLDGHLALGLFMHSKLHLPEFALAEVSLNVVEIFYGGVTHCCFDVMRPLGTLLGIATVEDADFVDREDYLKGVDYGRGAFKLLVFLQLDKDADQAMHVFVSLVVSLFIACRGIKEAMVAYNRVPCQGESTSSA